MSEHRPKTIAAIRRAAKARKQAPGHTHPVMLPTDPEVSRRFGRELRQSMRLDLNGLVAFQTLNKIKEIELRRKVADGGRVRVAFDVPQRAVTPGQSAVLYDGDTVLGGGVIEREGETEGGRAL